jgi:mannan endo-1,4-beta-mannosidase
VIIKKSTEGNIDMKGKQKSLWSVSLFCFISILVVFGSNDGIKPVTPGASPEAKALLKFLHSISGQYTLTGQHNYPNTRDRNSQFAARYIGETPVIWSTDWGFAKPGDTDSYLARPDIVEEAKRQHQMGSIITVCWHAVPPTANEPVTFRPQFGESLPESLATVQGQLSDRQFQEVLTPGTALYKHWCAQVDTIAVYLKKLQDAHVPVLWRPYHEMNGNWFWWGGRVGKYGTAALYRQIFDRLVHYHKLNNLIWVWSVDRPNNPEMQFSNYYPGDNYLDVLALDVYGRDFNQVYYDSLVTRSNGKPLLLGEVGNPPTTEILTSQPKWVSYVIWAGMVRNTLQKQYKILVDSPRILSKEDSAYWRTSAPYRNACGLLPLPLQDKSMENSRLDFSGTWVFNEDKSVLDNWGVSNLPYILKISQQDNKLTMQKTYIVEYADNRITNEELTLDGKECQSEMWNSPRIMTARWSAKNDTLFIDSKVILARGGRSSEMKVNETWSLQDRGTILAIRQFSTSFWGQRDITMIFDKQVDLK